METQNTQEIEVWKVELNSEDVVIVDYTVYESDSKTDVSFHQIAFATLLKHVRDTEMNKMCINKPEDTEFEYAELDADIFTRENLYVVVKDYLTENLK
jgi:hypothetical protein